MSPRPGPGQAAFDWRRAGPVAEVVMPQRVPYGFHATFIPEADLAKRSARPRGRRGSASGLAQSSICTPS